MSGAEAVNCKSFGLIVGLLSQVSSFVLLVTIGILGDVPVVVSEHLLEEHLALVGLAFWDKVSGDKVNDFLAHLSEFLFDLDLVILSFLRILNCSLLVFFSFDQANDSPCSSSGSHDVLEGNAKNVSLVDGKLFLICLGELTNVIDHLVKSIALLG